MLELWAAFCATRQDCSDEARDFVHELVDEEVHAFPSAWYRTYPSMLTDAHEDLQRLSPKQFVTPYDALLRDFLRFRHASV